MSKQLVKVIVRGVEFKVTPEFARELRETERKMLQEDLKLNRLID